MGLPFYVAPFQPSPHWGSGLLTLPAGLNRKRREVSSIRSAGKKMNQKFHAKSKKILTVLKKMLLYVKL